MARLRFRLLHPLKARRYARGGVIRGEGSYAPRSGTGAEWVIPLNERGLSIIAQWLKAELQGPDNPDAPSS